jgi:gamma-glutamylputrescine oxidase
MPEIQDTEHGLPTSWYTLSANRLLMTHNQLRDDVSCDVCIVGGGFTGLSAAVELKQRGLSVVLLEKKDITSYVGQGGGVLLRGFGLGPAQMVERFGSDDAKTMRNASLEGLALVLERIAKMDIKCDLKFGHLTLALKTEHMRELGAVRAQWDKIGHGDLRLLSKKEARDVAGDRGIGGLLDPKGAHLHLLNYALGLAQGAMRMGCKLHDRTPVTSVTASEEPVVRTQNGSVRAKFVILAGAVKAKGAGEIWGAAVPATSYMLATEPLREDLARRLLPGGVAVTEAWHAPDHYRLTEDNRLLFGGNRPGKAKTGVEPRLRTRMISVFPELRMSRIEHVWHTPLDMTLNRLPHAGKISPNVFYAHGFGNHGHGITLATAMGKILAEAIAGQTARFDAFARIRHASWGPFNKPLSTIYGMWDELQDKI